MASAVLPSRCSSGLTATAGLGQLRDYGWGWHGGGGGGPGPVLWSATGTVYDAATGTFLITIPAGTMGTWQHPLPLGHLSRYRRQGHLGCSPEGICMSARWSRARSRS